MHQFGLAGRRSAAFVVAAFLLSALVACGRSEPVDGGDAVGTATIKLLSNRADLVSGGDALVAVLFSGKTNARSIRMDLNGQDVTRQFALHPNGRYMGLLTGLVEGRNVLTARTSRNHGARIAITNHPNGGPIFAGEQIQPWPCLEGAIDAQCNRPVTYQYKYKSTSSGIPCAQPDLPPGCGPFKDYDPQNPPTDIATTTTDQGKTVPYIVRIENGSQDRGQYLLAVLFDPAQDWQPWAPQEAWNGKTMNVGGSGCGMHHGESEAPPEVMDDDALSRGFLVWSTALSHNTLNCNLAVQGESLMMAKERIVEVYGPIRYTIGRGGSGGSIKQQQAANSYPGIFDGIVPEASYPDTWSTMQEVSDCGLMLKYWTSPQSWTPGVVWTEPQWAAIAGHPSISVCAAWVGTFLNTLNPRDTGSQSCNIPEGESYDPQTNPGGVRCSFQDYMPSILGLRPQSAWGPVEQAIGRGFANRPLDNVGVQYGLSTLMSGTITPAQFIDLNAHIGSYDIDLDWQPGRVVADAAALPVSYRGGLVNQATNMDLPILDVRLWDPVEIHHTYRSFMMRARLDRAHGHHDNHVIWMTTFTSNALTAMDRWLAAIEADTTDTPYARKVVVNRPADVKDQCTEVIPQSLCSTIYPSDASPRIVAGQPFTDDVVKCQLKPLMTSDYFPVLFSDAEWGQLQQIFPQGVCDYAKPGVEQQPTLPWQTYSAGPGGQPMAAAPVSTAF